MRLLAISCAIVVLLPTSAWAANATSTFNADNDGWRYGTCTGAPPAHWVSVGGNPGGMIRASDSNPSGGDICTEWFVAPSAFVGDLRSNYGGTFTFDIRHQPQATRGAGVLIAASTGASLQRELSSPPPASTWTPTTFTLTEAGWTYVAPDGVTNHPATTQEFFEVLAAAVLLQVNADLIPNAIGTADFDNAVIAQPAQQLDTDGDGVANSFDDCPAVVGTAASQGCPQTPTGGDPGGGGGAGGGGGGTGNTGGSGGTGNTGGSGGTGNTGGGGAGGGGPSGTGGGLTPGAATSPPNLAAPATLTITATSKGVVKLARTNVACPEGGPTCTLTAKITVSRRAYTPAAVSVKPGAIKAVQLKLPRALLKKLKKAKKLKATIGLTAAAGAAKTSKTVQATLKAPRR